MGIRKSSSKPLKRKYPPGERRKKENYDFLPLELSLENMANCRTLEKKEHPNYKSSSKNP
jgi:hypothetical protein